MIRKNFKNICDHVELVENYEEAVNSPEKWVCHHRLECVETGAVVYSTVQDLIDWGLYYHQPPELLIFLRKKDHDAMHNREDEEKKKEISKKGKGHSVSESTREKISKKMKGNKNPVGKPRWNKGLKTGPLSEETKRKISESSKGKPGTVTGRHQFTDGKITIYAYECPEGFVPGRIRNGRLEKCSTQF